MVHGIPLSDGDGFSGLPGQIIFSICCTRLLQPNTQQLVLAHFSELYHKPLALHQVVCISVCFPHRTLFRNMYRSQWQMKNHHGRGESRSL